MKQAAQMNRGLVESLKGEEFYFMMQYFGHPVFLVKKMQITKSKLIQ